MAVRFRHRAGVAALLCLGTAVPGHAWDWTVSGFLNQRFNGSQGFGDGAQQNDDGLTSNTGLGLDFTARNDTTRFTFSPGVSGSFGTGDRNSDEFRVNPTFRSTLAHNGRRIGLNGLVSLVPQFRSARQFDTAFVPDPDTGTLEPVTRTDETDALQIVLNANLNASYALDARNRLTSGVFTRIVEYDETSATLQPTQTYGGSLGWQGALDPRTDASLTGTLRQFFSDREDQSDSIAFTLAPTISQEFTPRHVGNLTLGFTAVEGDEFNLGFTGGAGLTYRGGATTVNFRVRQSVEQDDFGEVEMVSSAGLSLNYRINPRSTIGLTSQIAYIEALEGGRDARQTFTIGPRYSLTLTEAWSLSLAYGLTLTREEDDVRGTNRLFLTFARSFDVLP
jgi:hypothetical protein